MLRSLESKIDKANNKNELPTIKNWVRRVDIHFVLNEEELNEFIAKIMSCIISGDDIECKRQSLSATFLVNLMAGNIIKTALSRGKSVQKML